MVQPQKDAGLDQGQSEVDRLQRNVGTEWTVLAH